VNCYAEAMMDKRYGKVKWGPQGTRVRTSEEMWKQPLRWNKETWRECLDCGRRGKVGKGEPFYMCRCDPAKRNTVQARQRVFCGSLMDVGDHHPSVLNEWIEDLVRTIEQTPNLDWLLLTKRPEDLLTRFTMFWGSLHWPENVWVGVSVENQKTANERIPVLQTIPAAVRFLSCEPLLEYVDLSMAVTPDEDAWDEVNAMEDDRRPEEFVEECEAECDWVNCGNDLVVNPEYREWEWGRRHWAGFRTLAHKGVIDWVICGGESGPRARPMDPMWARALRDVCDEAGVHFFFKSWGEYVPLDHLSMDDKTEYCPVVQMGQSWMVRAGRKTAGQHVLDGRNWREVPGG
jgi:protein gp37